MRREFSFLSHHHHKRYFMPSFRFVLFLSLAVVSVSFFGCRKEPRPADLPDLFPVSVKVEQEGKPVSGAIVSLNHADGVAKWSATCETGSDGIAKNFFTNGKYKGVALGKYQVCVRKLERQAVEKVDLPPEPKDEYERYLWRQKYNESQKRPESYDLIDAQYFDPRLSKLEIEVTAGGKNEFTVDAGKPAHYMYRR